VPADQALLGNVFNTITGAANGTRIDATGTIVAATTPRSPTFTRPSPVKSPMVHVPAVL
jgi:hypothetical protein